MSGIPKPTANQLKRVRDDWKRIAKEPLEIEWMAGTLYGLTTELGALRLAHKFAGGRAEYSKSLKTWVFALGGSS